MKTFGIFGLMTNVKTTFTLKWHLGVCLFKDKHTPKCHLRFFVDILKLWVIVTLSLSNITSRTKVFTISFRTGISCISPQITEFK